MRFGIIDSAREDLVLNPESTQTVSVNSSMSSSDIQGEIDALGKYIPYGTTVTIQFGNGTYTCTDAMRFQGFYGGGKIVVAGDMTQGTSARTDQNVVIDASTSTTNIVFSSWYNDVEIEIRNFKFILPSNTQVIYAFLVARSGGKLSQFNYNYVLGNGWGYQSYGVSCYWGAVVNTNANYFSNIFAAYNPRSGAALRVQDMRTTGTSPKWGVYCQESPSVYFSGSVSNYTASYGVIFSRAYEGTVIGNMPNYTVNCSSSDSAAVINEKIGAIPRYLPSQTTIIIQFADGTYTLDTQLYIQGFYGGGVLRIRGNINETDANIAHITQQVYLNFTGATNGMLCRDIVGLNYFEVRNFKVQTTDTAGAAGIYIQGCKNSWTQVAYNYSIGAGKSNSPNYCYYFRESNAYFGYNYAANHTWGVAVEWNANVAQQSNVVVSANRPTYGQGMYYNGCIGMVDTTQIGGASGDNIVSAGGELRPY